MSDVVQVKKSEPGIVLTEAAQAHLRQYLSQEQAKAIRLAVKKTGCSGLSYVVDTVQSLNPDDMSFPVADGLLICVERKSYPFLKGLTMDYVKQGLNHKFVFENPNQTGQCGCGESFTV